MVLTKCNKGQRGSHHNKNKAQANNTAHPEFPWEAYELQQCAKDQMKYICETIAKHS